MTISPVWNVNSGGGGRLTPWQAAVFALVATAGTLVFQMAVDARKGGQPALVIFTLPIMLSAYVGGWRAGLLATALSEIGASYYLLPPIHSFAVSSAADRWQQFLILLVGALVSASSEALHRERRRAESTAREYRQAQEALRRQADLLEQSHDAILVWERRGAINYWNRGAELLYGFTPAEARGRLAHQLLQTEPAIPATDLERDLQRARWWEGELRQTTRDGRKISVASRVTVRQEGERAYVLETDRDLTESQRSERALERALQRLSEAQRIGQVGDWEWDLATQAITWSPQVFAMVGRDPQLGPPRTYEEHAALFAPVSRAWLEAKIAAAIESGEPQDYHLVARRPDGTRVQIHTVAEPVKDASGRVLGLHGTAQDISARQSAERLVRESEARLSFALEAAEIVEWDLDLRPERARGSPRHDQSFGYGERAPRWDYGAALAHSLSLDRARFEAWRRRAMAGDGGFEDEFLALWPDGSVHWLWVKGHFCLGEDGYPERVAGIVEDLTEEKRAEGALMASELRYRRLFETAKDGILILDAETGMVVDVNPYLTELLGYTHAELLQKAVWELDFFKDIAANEEKFAELREKGYVRYEHLPLETSDGRTIEVELVSNVYWVSSGKVMQCNVRDVTARRQAEEAWRKIPKRILQAENAERRRIAHELHNATAQDLVAVMMNLGRLQELLGERGDEAGAILADSVALMENSVHEIRTLSYILHPPQLRETGLAGAVVEFAAGFGRRADIRVRVECPPDFPRLPEEIELALFRVVQESLSNVMRHSGSDSATVRLAKENGSAVLEVVDWGRGFSPEMMRQSHGAQGVGIVAMRERIAHFGGTLKVESSTLGVTVRVMLPLPEGTK